jgi:hypothetical protein
MTTHPTPHDALPENVRSAIEDSLRGHQLSPLFTNGGATSITDSIVAALTPLWPAALHPSGLLGEGAADSPFSAAGADRALSRPKCEPATIPSTPQPGTGTPLTDDELERLENDRPPEPYTYRDRFELLGKFARQLERDLAAERSDRASDKTYWDKQNQHLMDDLAAAQEKVRELAQQLAASESAREELWAALEPFAALSGLSSIKACDDNAEPFMTSADLLGNRRTIITIGDIRKAADAYKKQSLNPAAKAE